ncbi:replication initiation protein RepC, partial [Mesorhizobium sp. M1A.F.Ca.IN.020.32.1.1]
ADAARPSMGISPSAWQDAVEVMGAEKAAITAAAILERAGQIASRGGYLRNLTERAREQKFSVWPMIMALLRAKLEARAQAVSGDGSAGKGASAVAQGEPTSKPSNALLENLKKRGWDR